jgi:serine/threonine protein kinase
MTEIYRPSVAINDVAHEAKELLARLCDVLERIGETLAGITSPSVDPTAEPTSAGTQTPGVRVGASLGPYRIQALLGAGGMGEIYRATDSRLGRTVALKVLPQRLSADAHRRRRLSHEGRLLSVINHPHICTLYDVGHSRGVDFLVMEQLEGRTLAQRVAAGPVRLSEALRIGSQIANALEALHCAGIVHGDLKPANIMLTRRRDADNHAVVPIVKLLDFGLARAEALEASDPTDASERPTKADPNNLEGTWPYMAPEQFAGQEIGLQTDVWALGVILYEMVCGRRPFEQPTAAALMASILGATPPPVSEMSPECSDEVGRIIERCLEKDASRRWASCSLIAKQLARCACKCRVVTYGGRTGSRSLLKLLKTTAAVSAVFGLLQTPAPSSAQPPTATTLERPQMEEFLTRGRVSDLRRISTGVTGSSRAVVTWQGSSHDAHVQTVDTYLGQGSGPPNLSDRYTFNVAAYRLDKMLGLNMVPVSVKRTVGGQPAAVTWWVDDVAMMEIERNKLDLDPPEAKAWRDQIHKAVLFQQLISNSDFNQTNILITRDWRLWLIDFTRSFRGYRKVDRIDRVARIEPEVREALVRLDEEDLRAEMKGLLTVRQMRAILARRDLILEHFDEKPGSSRRAAIIPPDRHSIETVAASAVACH